LGDETYGDVKGKRLVFALAVFYVLWIITAFLGFVVLFVGRSAVLIFMGITDVSIWSWRFFDKLAFILSGLIILVVVVASEYYLRSGIQKQRMVKRFCLVAGLEILVIFAAHMFFSVATGFLGRDWLSYLLLALELLVGGGLFAYSRLSISNRFIRM
jgi:hypothetical protein